MAHTYTLTNTHSHDGPLANVMAVITEMFMYVESSCIIHHCCNRIHGYNQLNVCVNAMSLYLFMCVCVMMHAHLFICLSRCISIIDCMSTFQLSRGIASLFGWGGGTKK